MKRSRDVPSSPSLEAQRSAEGHIPAATRTACRAMILKSLGDTSSSLALTGDDVGLKRDAGGIAEAVEKALHGAPAGGSSRVRGGGKILSTRQM